MKARHDWTAMVREHARRTGAAHLGTHAVDELAGHLEEMYLEARRTGGSDEEAMTTVRAALAESPLGAVPPSRTRVPDSRPHIADSRGWTTGLAGLAGELRFAWRQLRRAPAFAVIAVE